MTTPVPHEPLVLCFDPDRAQISVRQVFADNIARSLFLLLKSAHVVTSDFEDWCLVKAQVIRESWPLGPQALHSIIYDQFAKPGRGKFLHQNWEESKDWLERLIEAIDGTRPVKYQISTKVK